MPRRSRSGRVHFRDEDVFEKKTKSACSLGPVPILVSLRSSSHEGDLRFTEEVYGIHVLLCDLHCHMQRISQLRAERLNVKAAFGARYHEQDLLDEQIARNRQLVLELKDRITWVISHASDSKEKVEWIDMHEADLVGRKFLEVLEGYSTSEQNYSDQYRSRLEHHIKLIKPDATEQEVNIVLNDTAEEGWQVVTRALAQSRSYSETRMAYLEAQEYHAEIIQIEENISDLSDLIHEMKMVVEPPEKKLYPPGLSATDLARDLERNNELIEAELQHLRYVIFMRRLCLCVAPLVVIGVAAVVTWYFTIGPAGTLRK